MNKINQKFIGTWMLVYSVEIDSSEKKFYPFGEDAIGYIMYDASNKMAVQICRKERKLYGSKSFASSSPQELSLIPKDYLAYFGSYEIDTEKEIIRHFADGHLFPNNVGQALERKYHFFDNKMSLKPCDGTNREILWKKINIS
jgi:catechol 1,2-dioxygenase